VLLQSALSNITHVGMMRKVLTAAGLQDRLLRFNTQDMLADYECPPPSAWDGAPLIPLHNQSSKSNQSEDKGFQWPQQPRQPLLWWIHNPGGASSSADLVAAPAGALAAAGHQQQEHGGATVASGLGSRQDAPPGNNGRLSVKTERVAAEAECSAWAVIEGTSLHRVPCSTQLPLVCQGELPYDRSASVLTYTVLTYTVDRQRRTRHQHVSPNRSVLILLRA
jgi:hypothetical protein